MGEKILSWLLKHFSWSIHIIGTLFLIFSGLYEKNNVLVIITALLFIAIPIRIIIKIVLFFLNIKNKRLLYAIEENDKNMVLHLLEKGADVNYLGRLEKDGEVIFVTPIMLAVLPEAIENEIFLKLVEKGADVNYVDTRGRTPLLLATIYGFVDRASVLIEKGANVNYENLNYGTPLIQAIRSKKLDMVSLLINAGADVNKITELTGWNEDNESTSASVSPLMAAVDVDDYEIVSLLIEKGAVDNIKISYGKSLSDFAAETGKDKRIIDLLKEKGM